MGIPTELSYWAWGWLCWMFVAYVWTLYGAAKMYNKIKAGDFPEKMKQHIDIAGYFVGACPWGVILEGEFSESVKWHEYAHLYTGAAWIIGIFKQFSWLLWYQEYGLFGSILLGFLTTCGVQIILEAVADIGAMALVGPWTFIMDIYEMYLDDLDTAENHIGDGILFRLVVVSALLKSLLFYPLWRLWIQLAAILTLRRRHAERKEKRKLRNRLYRASDEIAKKEMLLAQAKDDVVIEHLIREIGELTVKRGQMIESKQHLVASDARSIYDIC